MKNEKGKIVKKNNIHLFANLLECDVCHNNFSSSLDRPRVNQGGYRHSMYNCYGRRIGACKSKYVSDVYLGKFVFNYIANLYKAYCSFGKSTTFETFKKKMLRGNIFSDIKEVTNLEGIYNIFCQSIMIKQQQILLIIKILNRIWEMNFVSPLAKKVNMKELWLV